MGFIKPTFLLKGAVQEGVEIFDEAEKVGKEGMAILKEAKEEVKEEINSVSNNFDKAIALSDTVGGGAFGKYLFNYYPKVEQLAAISDLAPKDRDEALSRIKSNYDNLPDATKARLTDGDFSEMVQANYDKEVNAVKVKGGLVNNNNMGEATASTLIDKVQNMVNKRLQPQREDIISSVGGRDLRESVPVEGGFEAIPSGMQGEIPYLNAGAYGMEYQELKNTAESAFEKYLESNRFKVDGTNMYLTSQKFDEVASIVFPRLSSQEAKEEISSIATILGYSDEQVVEDMLKQKFLDRSYGGTFKYTGVLSMIDQLNEAADASVE